MHASTSFGRTRLLALLMALSAAALNPACKDESSESDAQSGATNWLRCSDDDDCASAADAACAEDGYCVDEAGERIEVDPAESDSDTHVDTAATDSAATESSSGETMSSGPASISESVSEPSTDQFPTDTLATDTASTDTLASDSEGGGTAAPEGGAGGGGRDGSASSASSSDAGQATSVTNAADGGASTGGTSTAECEFDSCHPERCDEEGEPCCDPFPGDGMNYCGAGLECTEQACALPAAGEVCGNVQCDAGLICCDHCLGQCVDPLSGAACADDTDPERSCDEPPCGDYPVCIDGGGADVSCTQCLSIGTCPELLCTPTLKEACDAFCPAPNLCRFTFPPQPPQQLLCEAPRSCDTADDCGNDACSFLCDDGCAQAKCADGFCVPDCQ